VDASILWERLKGQPERRKIGELRDPAALGALLAERRPGYEKVATHRLKKNDMTQALIELKHLLRSLWPDAP
jgi:shikimate kinase